MHPLHFRYVTECPSGQTCGRLFQLLDDMAPALRAQLLRDVFHALNVFPSDASPGPEEANDSCYREFRKRFARLAALLPEEGPLVYGMVCYVLSNAYSRSTQRLFCFIEQHRELADTDPESRDSLDSLREEEHQVRVAYRSFCELVVAALLNEDPSMDFGSEWLVAEGEPDEDSDVGEAIGAADSHDLSNLEQISKLLFPLDEESTPPHPVIVTFLDQLAANFQTAISLSPQTIAVRIVNQAMLVSVGEYCAPSESDPTCPLVLRLQLRGVPFTDVKLLKGLGLAPTPRSWMNCRLEFSILPNELARLATWTADWIRGQQSRNTLPPPIPIRLAGENRFFDFVGDPAEQSPFVEMAAQAARHGFAEEGQDWLSVEYLWSKAAREAYNLWNERHQDSE
jgi:hypothetical protein